MDSRADLKSLLHDIELQLYAEYPDKEIVEYELEHMTVKRFLEMLSYIY